MAGGLRLTEPQVWQVRPCVESDLDRFPALGSDRHVAWCRECFARNDVVILVAAAGDGRIAGKLHVGFGDTAEGVAQVVAASVAPELQGRGIGTRLMEAAERLACEAGRTSLELGVEDSNPRARRLYERLGYVAVREGEFAYADAPVPNPGVWMRKKLSC